MSRRKWIDPQAFRDLRRFSGMTRKQAAEALDVTPRCIQNWETGGSRIPWMAYRLLRVLRGVGLPGIEWQGWQIHKGKLYSPAGRGFDVAHLEHIELVFTQARMFRQMYSKAARRKQLAEVVAFPARKQASGCAGAYPQPADGLALQGGTR